MICPSSMRQHADAVLRGEYALPTGYELAGVRCILDIGANVGAFSLWATKEWPGARVLAYEPSPANVELLRRNTELLPVSVIPRAVGSKVEAAATFYVGKNNCGETSRYDLGEQDTSKAFVADVVSAFKLDDCDVLKVDTEGCELEILEAYFMKSRASLPMVVMLEWHRPGDRWRIGALLTERGYDCVRDDVRGLARGILVWVQT